ncbi:MAG: TonB family protein [Proteobacteria bacterium]|nr:TonB family protein [Pseudomonadota bacterium]
MVISEHSNLEGNIASLEVTLLSLKRGLSFLALLILVVLLLLIYISVRELFTTSATQFVPSAVQTSIPQQTGDELASVETATKTIASLTLELRSAELLAIATQRSLEESQTQLEGTQGQLEESQAQLERTQRQLNESRAQLEENQSQSEETQQALQQALLGEEELIGVRQELSGQRAEASARLEQYQQDLEDAQRQVRDLQFQRNQLMSELTALSEVTEVIENFEVETTEDSETLEVGVAEDSETLETEIDEPAEDSQAIVDSQEVDIVVQEELVRRAPASYPSRAANRNIEGSCEVEFTVTADGEVSDPVIVESDPRGVFDNACLDAIVDFEYRPKTINGVPVDAPGVRISFRFEFN